MTPGHSFLSPFLQGEGFMCKRQGRLQADLDVRDQTHREMGIKVYGKPEELTVSRLTVAMYRYIYHLFKKHQDQDTPDIKRHITQITAMGLMTLVHLVFLCIALHQLLKIIAIWLITGSWHNLWRILPCIADDEQSDMSDHESSLNWGDEFSFLIFDYSLLSDDETLVQLFLACVMIRHQSLRRGDGEQDVDPSHWVNFPWRVMETIKPRFRMCPGIYQFTERHTRCH